MYLFHVFILLILMGCTVISDNSTTRNASSSSAPREETEVRIQFAGDIFLHQRPLDVARQEGNSFDFNPFLTHIRPFINGDLAIANLESPVDARGNNDQISSFPNFNAPFEILEAIDYAGFDHLITANNHSFDFGFEGLVNTVNNIERVGLTHTGMNVDRDDLNTPTILDVNGIQVGILSYTDSVNGLEHLVPEASRAYAVRRFRSDSLDDIPRITQDMADLREAGVELVIVALHWGDEYVDAPTDMQRQIARALGDAGADVIMGKHSHTVQPIEWHYREDGTRALIMYSLGNFLADQTGLTDSVLGAHDSGIAEQIDPQASNLSGIPFPGRTQFGMLVSLQVTRDAEGTISLETVEVLPTLCMRDYDGNTLGTINGVSVMPLVDGELPEFVTCEALRNWGRVAYQHVVRIVGEEFVRPTTTE